MHTKKGKICSISLCISNRKMNRSVNIVAKKSIKIIQQTFKQITIIKKKYILKIGYFKISKMYFFLSNF